MAKSLGDIVLYLGANITNLNKGLAKAEARTSMAVGKITKYTDKLGKTLTGMGTTVLKGMAAATAAIGVAGVSVLKMQGNFESAFAGVKKTVDATEEEFDQLKSGILDMATRIPKSQEELAGIMEVAGQLGVRGVDNLLNFTETIAALGETTNIVGEDGALALSRFMNVMGTAGDEVDNLGSAIVALGNKFAARESEILDISRGLAPLGRQLRMTESQVLALATAIAASGGESQAATTAFQKIGLTMKTAILDPSRKGQEMLDKFAQVAGTSAAEFKRAYEEDAMGALVIFLEGLKRIDDQGKSTSAALDGLGLADQRLIREIGKVVFNLDGLTAAIDESSKAYKENVALTDELRKRNETFFSAVGRAWSAFKNIILEASEEMLGPISELFNEYIIPSLEKMRHWVKENDTAIREWMQNAVDVALEKLAALAEWVIANKDQIIEFTKTLLQKAAEWGPALAKWSALAVVVGLVFQGLSSIITVMSGVATAFNVFASSGALKAIIGTGTLGSLAGLTGFVGLAVAAWAAYKAVMAVKQSLDGFKSGGNMSNWFSRNPWIMGPTGYITDWMSGLAGKISGSFGAPSENDVLGERSMNVRPYTGLSSGGIIPGPRTAGDIFPAMLSPGEAVIPRSAVSRNPMAVDALLRGGDTTTQTINLGGVVIQTTGSIKDITDNDVDRLVVKIRNRVRRLSS